jgi:hypothetical protein
MIPSPLRKSIDTAYRKFSVERFPLPTEARVAELEQRIAIRLPDDFREFVLTYNGGCFSEPHIIPPSKECPLDRLTFMHGIGATHPTAELGRARDLALWDDNDPPQIVPIGYTIMGNFILVITHAENQGWVLLRTSDESFFLAESIAEFMGLLHEPLYQ